MNTHKDKGDLNSSICISCGKTYFSPKNVLGGLTCDECHKSSAPMTTSSKTNKELDGKKIVIGQDGLVWAKTENSNRELIRLFTFEDLQTAISKAKEAVRIENKIKTLDWIKRIIELNNQGGITLGLEEMAVELELELQSK